MLETGLCFELGMPLKSLVRFDLRDMQYSLCIMPEEYCKVMYFQNVRVQMSVVFGFKFSRSFVKIRNNQILC